MNVNIIELSCCNCGASFWLTEKHNNKLRRTHEYFYCPNGHQQNYLGDTCEAKLERMERNLINQEYDLSCEKRSNSALRGVITKLRNK